MACNKTHVVVDSHRCRSTPLESLLLSPTSTAVSCRTKAGSVEGLPPPVIEEDEIDLRPYILTVLRHWKLIVGLVVVAAGTAAAVSLTAPATYEASTTIAIAAVGAQPTPQAKAYIDLATSDKVVVPLAQELASASGSGPLSASDLKGKLKAAGGSEARLVTLKVQDTDPDRGARIAGTWGPVFVRVANSNLNPSQATIKDLESQSKVAREQLSRAEDELAAQESRGSVALLTTQLDANQKTLGQLYVARMALRSAGEKAGALQNSLRQRDPGSPSTAADDLALMQIQAQILGSDVQLQLPGPSASSGRTAGAQLAYLDSLSALIGDRSAEIEKQISGAQAAVLDAQGKLGRAQDEQAPLLARRDNLRQTITDLDLKASQLRVATAAGTNQARLLPDSPVQTTALSRGTTKNVAVAILLALMAGVAAAFGMEYLATRRTAGRSKARTDAGVAETSMPAQS